MNQQQPSQDCRNQSKTAAELQNQEAVENHWRQAMQSDPEHSRRYAQRWRDFVAEGKDIDGEARMIDTMAARGSRILDAGCGTGRTGGYLSAKGHEVVGLDLDPYLVSVAQQDFPIARWFEADLENLDASLSAEAKEALATPFDVAVSAGQVFGIIAAAGRRPALRSVFELLRPGGRAVIGFGDDRAYPFDEFFVDAQSVGFSLIQKFSTWELHPFTDESGFLVAILNKPEN